MAADLKEYTKPYRTIPELLELLANRGLEIDDVSKAEQFLSSVNYYRFSGYVLQFLERGSRDHYRPGSCFSNIIDIYKLDQQLRDIFFEALEAVELTFRTQFARTFSHAYSSLGYLDPSHYEDARMLDNSILIAKKEVANTQNRFMLHLRSTYRQIPIWSLVEVMSLGWLVKLFSNLKKEEQRIVADAYEIKGHILQSYLRHVTVLRNMCAHHSRLFDNRTFSFKPLKEWRENEPVSTNGIFFQAVLLYRLMRPTSQIVFAREDWRARISNLFDLLPDKFGPFDYRQYASIPVDCKSSKFWIK